MGIRTSYSLSKAVFQDGVYTHDFDEHYLFYSIPFSFLLFLSVKSALCGSLKKISVTNPLTL
jgi:hypothetical protein